MLRAKSIGGERISLEDLAVLPQGEAGPSGASRASLQGINFVLGKRTVCPTGLGNEGRLMVLARNTLAFGPGTA